MYKGAVRVGPQIFHQKCYVVSQPPLGDPLANAVPVVVDSATALSLHGVPRSSDEDVNSKESQSSQGL